MGTVLKISEANYIIEKRFNIKSNLGSLENFSGDVLSVKHLTGSTSYQWVMSMDFSRKLKITTDVTSNIAANSLVLGVKGSTQDAFVLNISGAASSGQIRIFKKDGFQEAGYVALIEGRPLVAKGQPTVIEWAIDRIILTCTNGVFEIMYSDIPDWGGRAIGGMARGSVISKYIIEEL